MPVFSLLKLQYSLVHHGVFKLTCIFLKVVLATCIIAHVPQPSPEARAWILVIRGSQNGRAGPGFFFLPSPWMKGSILLACSCAPFSRASVRFGL